MEVEYYNPGNNGGYDRGTGTNILASGGEIYWRQLYLNSDKAVLVQELTNLKEEKEKYGLAMREMQMHKEYAEAIQRGLQGEQDNWIVHARQWWERSQQLEAEIGRCVSHCDSQADQIVELKNRYEDVQRKLEAAESRLRRLNLGKVAGAADSFDVAGATPETLRIAAERIITSVHDLSCAFLEFADEDWIRGFCTGLLNDSSIKIYRLLHVRYWIQAEFVRVAFGHLWNPDRHFLFSSLPVFSNIWHLQQYHFKRYNMLLADADNIPIQLMRSEGRNGNGSSTMQSTSEVCKEPLALAGLQLEFEQFWQKNVEDLRKM